MSESRVGTNAAHAVEPARPEDLAAVRRLLGGADLPDEGVVEQFGHFVVAREAGRLIGCACLEEYETVGLLRSVAVAPDRRGNAVARSLVEALLDRARTRGMTAVYLLTETAAGYFARYGFRRITRDAVRPEALASTQFQGACCVSATAMVLELHQA